MLTLFLPWLLFYISFDYNIIPKNVVKNTNAITLESWKGIEFNLYDTIPNEKGMKLLERLLPELSFHYVRGRSVLRLRPDSDLREFEKDSLIGIKRCKFIEKRAKQYFSKTKFLIEDPYYEKIEGFKLYILPYNPSVSCDMIEE